MSKEKTKQKSEDLEHGKVLTHWSFSEVPEYKRSKSWFIGISIIFAILVIYALVASNFLFFFILVLFGLIFFLSYRSTNKITFQITEDGIVVGSKFYDYNEIQDFWIAYKPPEVKMLYFTPDKFFLSNISVPLENQNPVHIRKLLLKYIDENSEKDDMPFADHFSRLLKL